MSKLQINRIIELQKQVADKIAAGEVVDRPLSIVKELVENAIDAGSSSIIVEIKNGGKSYIRVTDNGCGIEKDDVELAFKRHATSKIKHESDLDKITSLGFRGEALASISAVTRTELITKTKEEKSGLRVQLEGGEIVEKSDTGCPDGTTVIVEDLFYNTPARLKFMKPDSTESSLIIDFISKMALAYPWIRIRLINNGNILFSTPGKGDIYSNILTIYSREIGDKLIHLKEKDESISIEAFISNPGQSKTNRKSQIFFVNGRYISSKILEKAVSEAYHERLFDGRYPIAFLFINMEPDRLDVNIHPNKKEVRFEDEKQIQDFVAAAIKKNLNTKDAIVEIKQERLFKKEHSSSKETKEEQVNVKQLLSTMRKGDIKTTNIESVVEADNNRNVYESIQEAKNPYGLESEHLSAMKGSSEDLDSMYQPSTIMESDIGSLIIMGSVFGTYIVAKNDEFLYLIDQHAAHERVLYEQLLEQYDREEKIQQPILTPFVFHVSVALNNEDSKWMDLLNNIGFAVEPFGARAYIVKAIPVFMELTEASDFVEYIVDNISADGGTQNQNQIETIISRACKKAIKAHDSLDMKEIQILIRDLGNTKNPLSCPHGRPTIIKLSKYELDKMFKRV